jgi:UDP-N-acetylmuramate dehydrogenase
LKSLLLTTILKDISLKPYNTFGIENKATYFSPVNSLQNIKSVLGIEEMRNLPLLILGGGSNILLTKDFEGLVIKNDIRGIEIVKETDSSVFVKAYSGEIWHELVKYCVSKNYGGIENLSLIPGTVGAAPIQNIGAYGTELKEVFESLEALDLENCAIREFTHKECRFGYRDSLFKNDAKGKYFIVSVTLKLQKQPVLNTSYGAIKAILASRNIIHPTIADVSEAVCEIRNSKLPNPKVIGNAGSFFKNPEISKEQFNTLKESYPELPGYEIPSGTKVPAGWLIESCGWKGKKVGQTGSHKDQALVLVNYGNAEGKDVKELAIQIQQSVMNKFGIQLATEVNIL